MFQPWEHSNCSDATNNNVTFTIICAKFIIIIPEGMESKPAFNCYSIHSYKADD